MRIIWDEGKNEWLKKNRAITFEEICEKILKGDIIEVMANPSPNYPGQGVFVLMLNNYTWMVPFSDKEGTIKLITAFPSRKIHKKIGEIQ